MPLTSFWKCHFFDEICRKNFLGIFVKNWATFNSNFWSKCSWTRLRYDCIWQNFNIWKNLNILCKQYYAVGHIFMPNNPAIWSHWTWFLHMLSYLLLWNPVIGNPHLTFWLWFWNGDIRIRICMELFSRRRWRLVSAQVVSCCVYENTKHKRQCIKGNNQIFWQLDRYKPSPPSTKELHGIWLLCSYCWNNWCYSKIPLS